MNSHTIGSVGQLSKVKANKVVADVANKEPKQEEARFEDKDTKLNIISCKITPFTPDPDQNLHIFLQLNNIKYTISDAMTDLWPYGRVIRTSTGFHGEFFRKNDGFMSLMYLGEKREEAIKLMSRLVEQNIVIEEQQ